MEWLAASLAFLGTVYFAIHHQGFRRFLLYALGAVVALSLVAGALLLWEEHKTNKARAVAKTLIKPSEIEIADATLSFSYGSSADLKGKITNKSKHALASISVRIIIFDCPPKTQQEGAPPPPEPKKCNVVGEAITSDYVSVPPYQTRGLSSYVSFNDLPPLKEWS